MALQLGIWDSFERLAQVSPAAQYDERLDLVAHAESLGFYGYHVAEHHLTPLSMAPSPLIFLSALAQRTSTIRIGAMVVLLPLYPSVRLAEEICMVDALSMGRLELGVGRGIRDVEHEWFGHDPATTRDEFSVALARIRGALERGQIEVAEPGGSVQSVALVHEPTQTSGPRFWYVGNMKFAAAEGMSVLAQRPTREQVEEFWATWRANRDAGSPRHQGPEPLVGATRPVYVARTDEEAEAVARRAWDSLEENFWATDTRVGGRTMPRGTALGSFGGGDIRRALDAGDLLYGSPERVRRVLCEFLESAGPGFNYLVSGFQWGDITHLEARASLDLFASEVAPALRAKHATVG